jgi:hypothetical protein
MSNTPTESEFDIRALHTVFAQEMSNDQNLWMVLGEAA